jgi:pyruvate/2-oxoglutarate dehydrogenase complex dihydrolipoamide acyltransferase (E2) component
MAFSVVMPALEMAQEDGVKLSHTDLLIAPAARTLAKHPRMNASWTGDDPAAQKRLV